MGGLELTLAAAALLIGLTGTWSPCGFSMVETIGPTGHTGGRRTTVAACATFLPGAVAGGIITFGGLAALGALVPGEGGVAYLVAAGLAIGTAGLEATGTPITPQIRRQLPEHWRRVMPMPLAAALYGGLLGLGFTTFVLSFGVWAIAGVSFAVGDPVTGALIGAAFGIGRAVPIVSLAPLARSEAGARVTQLMADRPGLYRTLRLGDAMALAVAAAVLVSSSDALAERVAARRAADPGTADGLVFQGAQRTGYLMRAGNRTELPGKDPAIGGPYIAVRAGGGIRVLDSGTLAPLADLPAERVNAIAISRRWVAWRAKLNGRDEIRARKIADLGSPGSAKRVKRAKGREHLGMPSVTDRHVAFSVSSGRRNAIVRKTIRGRNGGPIVTSRHQWLHSPSIGARHMVFVRVSRDRQQLVQKRLRGGGSRTLHSRRRKEGTLWSTALGPRRAYATLIVGGPDRIISVSRR
jgi:hypothetical protein